MLPNLLILTVIFLFKDAFCASLEVFVGAGSLAVLPCKAPPQSVSPAVMWSNSKGSIWKMQKSGLRFWNRGWMSRVDCPHTQFERGDYSLHIQSVTEEDAGSYFCTVDLDNSKTLQTVVTLRVLTVSIWPEVPVVGQCVRISCGVSGREWPRGSTVVWTLNDSPYKARDARSETFRTFRDAELRVKAANSVRGKWSCVVRHKSKEWRASALLDVKGIVQPPENGTKLFAAVGSEVTLPCVFSDGLSTSDVRWERLHDASSSKADAATLPASFSAPAARVSSQDRTAGLREVGFEDAGWYRCSATANGHRIERSMQLVTAKVDVEVLSANSASLRLTCRLSDTSDVTDYEWVHTPFDPNGTQFEAFVQKGRTVAPLRASGGMWTCRFYGQHGVLGNVSYQIPHMEKLSGEKPRGVVHGAAILTGLGVLLLILLLTLIQMYRNYQRRKQIFQFPALETIIHSRSVEREMTERNQNKQ